MNNFLEKLLYPNRYYKRINGYYNLPDDLREKLEYYEKLENYDKNFGDKNLDKFFSWEEFKQIISVVHFLVTFNLGINEIYIFNDGKEYVYWLEQYGRKIEEKVSQNAFELLDNIFIEGKPMSVLWGSFD